MTSRLLKQDSNIQQYQHTHPHYSRSYFSSHCSFSINCKDTIIMDGSRERRRTREMTKKLLHKFNVLFSLTHSLTQSFSSPDFLSLSSMLLILSTGKNIFKKEIGWMEQLGFRFNVNFFLPFSFLSLSLTHHSLIHFARKSSHAQVSQPNIQNSFHRMDFKQSIIWSWVVVVVVGNSREVKKLKCHAFHNQSILIELLSLLFHSNLK